MRYQYDDKSGWFCSDEVKIIADLQFKTAWKGESGEKKTGVFIYEISIKIRWKLLNLYLKMRVLQAWNELMQSEKYEKAAENGAWMGRKYLKNQAENGRNDLKKYPRNKQKSA